MSVFRITRSLFIVYPFFWGVGDCYDVLAAVGAPPEALRWWSALLVIVLMATNGVDLRFLDVLACL